VLRSMRLSAIVPLLILCPTGAGAEDAAPGRGTGGRGYFGAPVVTCTLVRDQGALMFGGWGGWNLTPSLVAGVALHGTTTEVDAPEGAMPDSLGPMDVKFESFGFNLEYVANPGAPTSLTVNAFAGGAAIHYMQEKTGEQYGETDFVLLLQPAAGVEQRVTEWCHLNLALSYRLVGGVEQPGLQNSDINGLAVALACKFGRF